MFTWKFHFSCCLLILSFHLCIKAQVNTPLSSRYPFGTVSQQNVPYTFGEMPNNLPKGNFKIAPGTQYGKSQDAYTAYLAWKKSFVAYCGTDMARVTFDDPEMTVSEGIAYGMLLAAYAADKPLFDQLYRYYLANSNAKGVMHWKIEGCSTRVGSNGATDAELDAAMALLVAQCQWPDTNTPYDYSAEATTLINAIKDHEIHPTSYQTLNGDGWGIHNTCRNPSYFAPAYYKQFALHVPADSSFWAKDVVDASYDFLLANYSSSTGLVSNWAAPSGSPNNCNGPNEYGYDACRNPWRMAVDVLWHDDPRAKVMMQQLSEWLDGYARTCRAPLAQNAATPQNGASHNAIFVSTWATGVMGSSNQKLVRDFYQETVATLDYGYYGSTLRTLMLFVLSGNFWKPCPEAGYVELENFSAEQHAGTVQLHFSTSMETGNTHFNLYYSNDNNHFVLVDQIQGTPHSLQKQEYYFSEDRYIYSNGFYKISYVNTFGIERELKSIEVKREAIIEATFAPNPFIEYQEIFISSPDATPLPVRVVDMYGRIVFERPDIPANQVYQLQLPVASGNYVLQVLYDRKYYSFKIQKR
jgi:endo-1,4-beta-D-glucanase Y